MKTKEEIMEELDLKELFFMFWNKKLEIILITLMFVAVGIGYSYFLLNPNIHQPHHWY